MPPQRASIYVHERNPNHRRGVPFWSIPVIVWHISIERTFCALFFARRGKILPPQSTPLFTPDML